MAIHSTLKFLTTCNDYGLQASTSCVLHILRRDFFHMEEHTSVGKFHAILEQRYFGNLEVSERRLMLYKEVAECYSIGCP
jgi:hypothetical protein